MTNRMTPDAAAAFLRARDRFLIFTHRFPDGDTIGSAAALCLALRELGKTAAVYPNSTMPDIYLPYIEGLLAAPGYVPGCLMAVDIADRTLFTKDTESFAGEIEFAIDHHPANRLFPRHLLLDEGAAACGKIILGLIQTLELPVTPELALPLYLAISTDTGCFRYSNTTPATLRAAADLLETGIDVSALIREFFERKTRARIAVESHTYSGTSFYFGGKVGLCLFTRALIEEIGAADADLENIASLVRAIEGVRIGVSLRETGDGVFKVSVRTSADYLANRICGRLGGGGHNRAAGCTLHGTAEEASGAVLRSCEEEVAGA